MEKLKLSHIIYFIAFITIILLIVSVYKAEKIHENKLYLVTYNKINEAVESCYLKKDCSEEIVLNDLYEKKYLNELFDPVTKESIDKNLCIVYKEEQMQICSEHKLNIYNKN